MNLRKTAIALAVIILVALLLLMNSPPFAKRKPADINVILLTIDSIRPDHLGCCGYGKEISPNIDAIAEAGCLFQNAYAQSAWTIPGIMSVLTSLQPPVHRVEERGGALDPAVTTIFDLFRMAGYTVPNISFLLTIPEFSSIRIDPIEEKYFSGKDDQELFRWLDENHNTTFFAWYHHRGVHLPYKPKDKSELQFFPALPGKDQLSDGIKAVLSDAAVVPVGTVKFERADRPILVDLYDGEVRALDLFVGKLHSKLQELELLNKTLVVITADHGEELMDHGFVGHASTMHSATLYDEVIRIPLIMSLPGYLPGGIEIEEKAQQIDIMPTVLDIVGIPIPPGIQGRSLASRVFEDRPRTGAGAAVFAETVYGGYQATKEMARTRLRCVRTDEWKLIETDTPKGKSFQLFDLLVDAAESENVYDKNDRMGADLRMLLAEWNRENAVIREAIISRKTVVSPSMTEASSPDILFPYDGAVLRFHEREGTIRASWTGNPGVAYVVEYEIGTGVHHLTGSFITFGNRRDFGPYAQEMWSSIAVRNPWRVRISPDTNPRRWSDWIQFTFE